MSCSNNINNSNCQYCDSCFNNCSSCPNNICESRTMYFNNFDRINKQVRMDSSSFLLRLRTLNVSKQVGQSANPKMLGQAGGPGDLTSSIEKINSCKQDNCGQVTYRVPISKRRTANKGKIGVDKKHGSYARFLSRRVGGELRKEKMPGIRNRTAFIHQPRNRTGTQAACFNKKSCGMLGYSSPSKFFTHTRTAFKCNIEKTQQINHPDEINMYPRGANNDYLFGHHRVEFGDYCSQKCCDSRLPKKLSCNETGYLGNNTQGVSSSRCSCCITRKA